MVSVASIRARVALLLAVVLGLACTEAPSSTAGAPDAAVGPPESSRFVRIRELLRLSPEDEGRARGLFPVVAEICGDDAAQDELVEHAFMVSGNNLGGSAQAAADVIEHVATSCLRERPEAALRILDRASARLAHKGRFEIVRARFFATTGKLDAALEAAKRARELGVHHAVALEANLLADRARATGPGYASGALDTAIRATELEPDGTWQLVDVMALLSTRAKLLYERAVYEDAEVAAKTRREADASNRRLAVSPFPKQTRTIALDAVCFEAAALGDPKVKDPLAPCMRALSESGNLGAAFLLGAGRDPKAVDVARADAMAAMRKRLETLPKGSLALVVGRGDEVELVSWMFAAAEVIAMLNRRAARIVAVDRTSDPRASALFDRLFVIASAKPKLTVRLGRDPSSFGCLVAHAAGKSPECPLDASVRSAVAAPFGAAVLFGRDLDGEIDDLTAAKLPTVLLSFREPKSERRPDVQLVSLSDAWMMSPRAVDLAGALLAREKPEPSRE